MVYPPPVGPHGPLPTLAQAPIGPGLGRIVVNCSHFALSWTLRLSGPSVNVDNVEVGRDWGDTVYDVPAGLHRIYVYTRYMGQMGKANLDVQLAPGQVLQAWYDAPVSVFSSGVLTLSPPIGKGFLNV